MVRDVATLSLLKEIVSELLVVPVTERPVGVLGGPCVTDDVDVDEEVPYSLEAVSEIV
jgi:hypothetical protein